MEPHWLDVQLQHLAAMAPPGTFFSFGFNLSALLAMILVAITCGATGPLVVGGRMAFFSDALAHCAFAGVSIGFVLFKLLFAGRPVDTFWDYVTPIMVAFGMAVGFGIAWMREHTGLSSDTVIGVFFATSVALAATLRRVMSDRAMFVLEDFLFGNPTTIRGGDLVMLAVMAAITLALLYWIYNPLLLGGFSGSLALSRRKPYRLAGYLFIVLLAVIVNLCVRTVGILLINALLVVPAATAINVSRNLRQLFWLTLLITVFCCLAGPFVAWEVGVRSRFTVEIGTSGTVVLIAALLFAVSATLRPLLRRTPNGAGRVTTG
jgi:zinc transport system permease protein